MIYRFTLISDEVDQFRREIQIDPDAKFLDLYQAILKSVNYAPVERASFFVCDEDWEHKEEITLSEQDDNPEEDSWIMSDTDISEFIEDEQQRLVLQFNIPDERFFFIELSEIITGKNISIAKCTKKAGEPPHQFINEEKEVIKTNTLDVDETFYGDQDYDSLEIEGFENIDEL